MALFEPDRPQTGFDRTPLGKILHLIGTGERLGTKHLLLPLVQGADPAAYQRLRALGLDKDLYASDVYQALNPDAGGVERAVAGGLLGAAVDPLTYLSGGLTRTGRLAKAGGTAVSKAAAKAAAKKAGKKFVEPALTTQAKALAPEAQQSVRKGLMPTLESRGLAGQWSPLQVRVPFQEMETGQSLLPNEVSGWIGRRLDLIQQGKIFQQAGLGHVGKVVDQFTTNMLAKFGIGIGMDRWFWSRYKQFLSSVLGRTGRHAAVYAEELEDQIRMLGNQIASKGNVSEVDAVNGIKEILANMEASPELKVFKDATGLSIYGKRNYSKLISGKDAERLHKQIQKQFPQETQKGVQHVENLLREAFEEKFGTPPVMGGPASMFDTQEFRSLRELALEYKWKYDEILRSEQEVLGKSVKLWSHPDQLYVLHMMSEDARKLVFQRMEEMFTMRGLRAPKPSATHASMIPRKLRMVSKDALEELRPYLDKIPARGSKLTPNTPTLWAALMDKANLGEIPGGALQRRFYKAFERYEPEFNRLTKKYARDFKKQFKGEVDDTIIEEMAHEAALAEMPVDPKTDAWQRVMQSMSPTEANTYIWEKGLKLANGVDIRPQTLSNFFDTDPTRLLAARKGRAERAILTKELFEEVKFKGTQSMEYLNANPNAEIPVFAVPKAMVRGGDKRFDGWMESTIPELRGHLVHPDTARWFNRMAQAEKNLPKELTGMGELYNKLTQVWKAYTLSLFPVYHVRNFVGNVWNYWLSADNAKDALENGIQAEKMINAIRNGRGTGYKITDRVTGKVYNASQIWDEVAKRGGWGVGFLNPDDPISVGRQIAKTKKTKLGESIPFIGKRFIAPEDPLVLLARDKKIKKLIERHGAVAPPPAASVMDAARGIKNADNAALETGFRLGEAIENRTRLAHVIQKLKSGASMDEAVMSMKKVLFDYHDLSPVERGVIRHVFPFYAWSRKNIPYQLEMLVTKPEKIARFNGALRGYAGWEQPPEEDYVNNYLRKNFPLRLRKNSTTGQMEYFTFKNWLPIADIHDLVDPIAWAQQSLHPAPKAFIEWVTNTNMLTRRKVDYLNNWLKGERHPYWMAKLVGKEQMPDKVIQVLNGLRPIATINQWVDNPQEQDFHAHLLRFFAGRTYQLDTNRAMREFQQELDEARKDTRSALLSAMHRRAGAEEIGRLMETGQEKQKKVLKKWGRAQ